MKVDYKSVLIGLAVGFIAHKVCVNRKNKSNFSSACGCGE